MYVPRHNAETRLPILHAHIAAHPLATLVSLTTSGLFATHLPMVLHAEEGEFGALRGHISRANLHGRTVSPKIESLAIFQGPQQYISATWYPGKYEHGEEVPTWNYAVVHAYGSLKVIEDSAWLLAHLKSLTAIHEAASSQPWRVEDAPPEYIAAQMRGIVGLELPIARIEGKWKVSQNRDQRDRTAVIAGLEARSTEESHAMAHLVRDAKPTGC